MNEEGRTYWHTDLHMTTGYVGTGGVVARPQPTIEEIDKVIHALPREYKALAAFIRLSGIDPDTAISLTIDHALLGDVASRDWSDGRFVLKIYMFHIRANTLKRNQVPPEQHHRQVFLNSKARPITRARAETVLARASERMKLPSAVTLNSLRHAYTRSRLAEFIEREQKKLFDSHAFITKGSA